MPTCKLRSGISFRSLNEWPVQFGFSTVEFANVGLLFYNCKLSAHIGAGRWKPDEKVEETTFVQETLRCGAHRAGRKGLSLIEPASWDLFLGRHVLRFHASPGRETGYDMNSRPYSRTPLLRIGGTSPSSPSIASECVLIDHAMLIAYLRAQSSANVTGLIRLANRVVCVGMLVRHRTGFYWFFAPSLGRRLRSVTRRSDFKDLASFRNCSMRS